MGRDRVEKSLKALVDVLQLRATDQGQDIAFRFVVDDDGNSEDLTYDELDEHAKRVGGALASRGLTGKRILLTIPPSLDYVKGLFGCLYGGAIPVPSYPPRTKRTLDAQISIVSDCEASAVLAPRATRVKANRLLGDALNAGRANWVDLEDLLAGAESDWRPPTPGDRSLCYLQYTSGSTGSPKGVRVGHRHVLRNLESIAAIIGPSASDHIVSWLPPFHDMGLVGGILTPLFTGIPASLLSPAAAISRPLRWLKAISSNRATVTVAPNFAFDLCVREIREDQKDELDLSSLKIVFVGAEPVRAETLSRFARAFEACGFDYKSFYPCYGLAEATLIVSGGQPAAAPVVHSIEKDSLQTGKPRFCKESVPAARKIVGCGSPIDGTTIEIVEPNQRTVCDSGAIGEVWVAGPSVADGYWNNSEDTTKTFAAHLAGYEDIRFLRTGDLGFVQDGELFITGRWKDVIIIRGRNLFPQDIEACAAGSCHSALQPTAAAAFSIEVEEEESYAVVQEMDHRRTVDNVAVIEAIRCAVADETGMEPGAIVLVKPATIPRTSSGKIKRAVCRTAFNRRSFAAIATWYRPRATEIEAVSGETDPSILLREEVSRLLGAPVGSREASAPLSHLGLDSLKAVQLAEFIGERFSVKFDEVDAVNLLDGVTLDQLSLLVATRSKLDLSSGSGDVPSDKLRNLIDAMSDEEVNSMLAVLDQER